MTRVKICGLMGERDIEAARFADYLGFVVGTGTRRSLSLARAKELMAIASRPAVIVTTSTDPDALISIAKELRPHALQVSGPVRPEDLDLISRQAGCQVWAVVHVDGETTILPPGLARAADLVVLDSPSVQGGGEGRTHDWTESARLKRELGNKPVSLAGGLDPENVAEAIRVVRPDLVDVSSGVEAGGKKDAQRIDGFISAVRRC